MELKNKTEGDGWGECFKTRPSAKGRRFELGPVRRGAPEGGTSK
jgi:hypothetical protein